MKRYLYIAIFISGMTSMGVEMAASRLLGNVFGTSNLVWASIIGIILIYLAAGYFVGGRWADRSPYFATFYQILIWAGLTTAVIPLASRPVLRVAANAFDQLELGVLFGSFTTVLVLLIIPVTLLGTASPFAIRLAIHDPATAGRISGRIYAISTLGSFIGTFLPSLVFIPLIGTYRTFLLFGAVLLAFGLVGLWATAGWRSILKYLWTPVLILALAWLGVRGSDKATPGLVYETESYYNYIQVLEQDGYYYLRLNEGQGVHSIYNADQLIYNGPWEQVLVAPFFNPAPYDPANFNNLAIVGLAAGTTAHQASAVYPDIHIDGYEIDPKIVSVARTYFDMNEPNLDVHVQDGRWGLEHSPERYQVISVDAYRPPYIPAHMTTQEFFQIVYDHLTPDGVMVINIGRGPNDRRLINALASTIATVFPSIHVMDIPDTFNSILYASAQPTDANDLLRNYAYLSGRSDVHPMLMAVLQRTIVNLQPAPDLNEQVFTDDLAPVEWITNNMVLSFLFSGDMETLQ
jgi:spermidine synthase